MKKELFPLENHYLGMEDGQLFARYAFTHEFFQTTVKDAIKRIASSSRGEVVCLDTETIDLLRSEVRGSKSLDCKSFHNTFLLSDFLGFQVGIVHVDTFFETAFALNHKDLPWTKFEPMSWFDIMEDPRYQYSEFEDPALDLGKSPSMFFAPAFMPSALFSRNSSLLYRTAKHAHQQYNQYRFFRGQYGESFLLNLQVNGNIVDLGPGINEVDHSGCFVAISTNTSQPLALLTYDGQECRWTVANGSLPQGELSRTPVRYVADEWFSNYDHVPVRTNKPATNRLLPLDVVNAI